MAVAPEVKSRSAKEAMISSAALLDVVPIIVSTPVLSALALVSGAGANAGRDPSAIG